MNSIRAFRFTVGLLAAFGLTATGMAQTATLTASSPTYSANGGSVTLTGEIVYPVGSNTVAGVTVTNGGTTSYTSAPTVVFNRGGGGTGATATASLNVSGSVAGIAVTNSGAGYTSAPTVVFSGGGGGSGVTATAVVSGGVVTAVNVTNPGFGYLSAPTIKFSGGATATASISSGVVTAVTVTNPGANYEIFPTVSFSGGGGSGATADVVVPTPSALGFAITAPAGWEVESVGGPNIPSPAPAVGATGVLNFVYSSFPANHASFTVTLDYPAGLTGSQTITATAQYRSPTVNPAVANVVLAPALSAVQAVASKALTAGSAAISFIPVTAANGAGPYTYAISPALPSSLLFSTSTGAITGTPAGIFAPGTFTVTITDSTTATASNTFSLTVNSALTSNLAVATKALTVNVAANSFTPVTILGGTAGYTYTVNPALPAGLILATGTGLVTGTPTVTEAATNHTVTITDGAGATTSKAFNLTVNPTPVANQAVASKTLTAGTAAAAFTPVAITAGTGTAPFAYAVSPSLPANLSFNNSTGAITGTPAASFATGSFTVTITDGVGATASNTFSLTVNGAVVATQAIATKALTAGTAATSFIPVTASGGTPGYVFTISPSLSAGLSLSASTGAITGTPTGTPGSTTYTITATDTVGATGSATFTLALSTALISTQAIATKALTLNTAAAFNPIIASGGTPPLSYTSINPALPAGLSLNSTTGTITGTPTVVSSATNYTITMNDGAGASTTNTFNLTVNPALVATQAIASQTLSAGTAASFIPVTASGGTPNYIFTILPALPAGLSLNASTGAITGTATGASGPTVYTVNVHDASVAGASAIFTLFVNGPVTANVAIAAKSLTVGAATSFMPVSAAGGTPSYTFSISPALPGTLSLSASTGTITGTPTAILAQTTYTVTVSDSLGGSNSKTFTLTINGALVANTVIASRALTAGTAAVSFTPVTGAAGTPPYTYTVSPALPATLVMSSAGAITGTATAASANAPYTVTVMDSVGATATNTFNLTVNVALAAGTTIANRTLTAGSVAASFTPLALTGGTLSYVWSVAPNLPGGLALNVTNGLITGTPAAQLASSNFTITGTDANGAQVSQVLALVINPALATQQAVASKTLSAGTATTVFTPVTASGGTTPYAFAISPALPAALSFDTTSGAITGTPNAALSATTFTVTVTDATTATSSKTFSLTVNGPLVANQTIATKALTATTLVASFAPVTGGGGTAPYAYAISPALPTGFSFSTTTGAVTGTPAAPSGPNTFTVTVTDSVTATATNTFALTVNPALTTAVAIATKAITAGTAVTAPNGFAPVTAADGTPPYTFTVSPALPAALTIAPSIGAISGTANAALPATNFTITATDSVGATSNKTFSLTVNVAPTAVAAQAITTKALTAGTAAIAFTPLTVQGGTPTFAFSVSPALPLGLAIAPSTGAITGTPTTATPSAVYVITATDSVGATVNQNLTLVVNAAPVATTAVPATVTLVNVAVTSFTPVTASLGTAPFTFAVSPALAAGLTLNPTTGAITGTPTVAQLATTYTVTATDSVGATASNTFTLKINRAPAITTQPIVIPFYLVDGTLTLSVVATGSPAPTYQWRKGGTAITGNASALTSTLIITPLVLTDAGSYDVVVTNEVSFVTSNAVTAIVYLPPAITTDPVSQTISAGGSVTFTTAATGNPTPTFQWRRNGAPLSGATSSTLTLNAVPLNGGGTIDVVATNPGGSATSHPATLTVNPLAPAFAAGLPTTATAVQGLNFFFPVAINNTAATFSVSSLAGPGGTLAVNQDTGALSGKPANLGTFSITITATNTTASASFTLSLTILAPPPVITSVAASNGHVGSALTFNVVATNTPSNYTATGLPPGLTIDATTGVISGTPTAAGTFTATVTATNPSGSINQPLVFTIDLGSAPSFTGGLNLSGVQGAAFTFTPAFGGSPFTAPFTATGLPAGLTLTNTPGTGAPTSATISGTPTVTGTYSVVITATNASGTNSVTFTLTINAAPTAPVISSASTAPAARVGTAFTFTLIANGAPTSFTATGLPAGLALNATTGVISGTPTVFGSFDVAVKATNGVGTGPASILNIAIAPSASAPVITSAPVAPGQVGQVFTYALSGSNTPTSFQITSGTLPAGLLLNATTGAITGTPLAAALGETRVWFNGTNATGGVGGTPVSGLSLEILFTIAPAAATPIVNSNGTATAQVGLPFQYTITASSGTTITGFAATGRPSWLALDTTTGILSGIPTEATTTPISIGLTASNSGGTGNPKTLLLTVLPAPATPVITSALTASGKVGVAFSYQISASETPTSFIATGLPPGLSLNVVTAPDSIINTITGTPTVSNSFAIALRAANAGGVGAPSTLTISVAPAAAAPAITSAAAAAGQVGAAFSYQIVATNSPILSYTLTGTLPVGLALNTSTGLITGTPADDPRGYTVQLTATNAGGTSLPQSLTITLAPALGVPVLTTPLYASGEVGVNFSFAITATNLPSPTGSPPAYATPVSLDAVNLPAGLAINPATGVIQGKPTTVGTTVATLTASNAAGTGPTRDLTITVQPALAAPVVTPGFAAGQVNQPFSYQMIASNSPTSYEVLGGPAWMALNGATGALTGSPAAPGNFTAQLVATNTAGTSSPATLVLAIFPAPNTPVVTSSMTQSGAVGTAMSFTVVVAPASPTPTFVATGLPAGLSLNPATGMISGTPTASGVFNVLLTPSNSNGTGYPVIIVITIAANVTFGG